VRFLLIRRDRPARAGAGGVRRARVRPAEGDRIEAAGSGFQLGQLERTAESGMRRVMIVVGGESLSRARSSPEAVGVLVFHVRPLG
jgi:hypothetical protein